MSEEETTVASQSSKEVSVSPETDSGETKSCRYRFIISCGMEKQGTGEGEN